MINGFELYLCFMSLMLCLMSHLRCRERAKAIGRKKQLNFWLAYGKWITWLKTLF